MEQDIDAVQEVENDLDMDYEVRLAEINKALEENAHKMAEIEQALVDLDNEKPKIFTLKELKEMKLEKQRKEKEELENEKREIDTITSSALKEAKALRENAKTEYDKLLAEDKATRLELRAIEHDLEIRKMIISESEEKLEDMLASFAIAESEFQKSKRSSYTVSKKSGEYYRLREEVYKSKSRKSSYLDRYHEIAKAVEKQTVKISDANKMLKVIKAI